jgi:hypothetical protein
MTVGLRRPRQAAEILLAEARALLDLLLSQALIPTQAREIPANQFTHVHARRDRDLHTLSLSTMCVIKRFGRFSRVRASLQRRLRAMSRLSANLLLTDPAKGIHQ